MKWSEEEKREGSCEPNEESSESEGGRGEQRQRESVSNPALNNLHQLHDRFGANAPLITLVPTTSLPSSVSISKSCSSLARALFFRWRVELRPAAAELDEGPAVGAIQARGK